MQNVFYGTKRRKYFYFLQNSNRGQKMGIGHSSIKLAEFTITYKEKTIKILSQNFLRLILKKDMLLFYMGKNKL